MNRKVEVYVKKAKRIYRTAIILGILIFLLGVLISIVYNKFSKKEPIDEVQTISNGDETESFTNDTGEVLLNPGKGWVLYNNIESNKYNDVVNIGYTRIDWSDVEKSEGEYNWDIIDQRIKVYENKGKKYSFGILCASSSSKSEYVTPKWVFDAGAKYYTYNNEETGIEQKIPVWTDEIFLEKLNNFVQALAQRYDGNKNIAFIDIRSYGNFGEQHLGTIGGEYISSDVLINSYLKPYREAFSKTLLVSPCGETRYNDAYKWGVENGISLRRDGIFKWSDGSECAMAYGKAPTVFEYTADYNWIKENNYWSYDNLIQYIENGKPSYIQFDPNMYNENQDFCKYIANKVGYYFKFKQASYTNTIKTTETDKISLSFINEGVAPLYEPCTTYIGLLDKNYKLVKKYKTDINAQKWMPSEEVQENIDIRLDGVNDGEYIMAVGLFYNEDDEKPTYLLGNTGKTDDNWYVFGKINIENPKEEYEIKAKNDEEITNQTQKEINVKIKNLRTDSNYSLKVLNNNEIRQIENIDNQNIEYEKDITVNLKNGSNEIKIQIEKDGKIESEFVKKVYVGSYSNDSKTVSSNINQDYAKFNDKYKTIMNQSAEVQKYVQDLKQNIYHASLVEKISEDKAEEMIKQHYGLMNIIVEKNDELKNSNEQLENIFKDIDEMGEKYENIVAISSVSEVKLDDSQNKINEIQNTINNNKDLNMTLINQTLNTCNDILKKAQEISTFDTTNTIKNGMIKAKTLRIQAMYECTTRFLNLYVNQYINSNPVTISYSETNPTNQDVTAKLETTGNIIINNNSNSNIFTFTQNGTFTFDYTIKGQNKQITAEVKNIDKTAPVIEDVENERLYIEAVTPKITDENLQSVELYKNNELQQNYNVGKKIEEDGRYKIVAKDQAGNQTEVEFDISKNPAWIEYSNQELTNEDIIASVNSNFDLQVINNSNQKTYVFNQNGEFSFELNIKGATLNLLAKVENIDKEPPTITGVNADERYEEKVTPIITDPNLKDVFLYLNDELVNDYKPNTEISKEGFYKIVATDKAGNETTVEFSIIENSREQYKYKDSYILNIKNNTTKASFDQKVYIKEKYEIKRNDTTITDEEKIATGDKLITESGNEYTLIVSGDITKDGDVNIKDIMVLRKYLLEKDGLSEEELLAADCNVDEKEITIKDLIRMRLIALERDAT